MSCPLASCWLWLLLGARAHAYETWHLVDISAAVCPVPSGGQCPEETCGPAPDPASYTVGIEQDSRMVMDAPHVISFLRTTSKALTVSFEVKDASNRVVVPETEITLDGFDGGAASATCRCTGAGLPSSLHGTYGASYGTACGQWDEDNCHAWSGDLILGDWCCDKWCYADASCPDAMASPIASTGSAVVYFSYQVCNPQPTEECDWVGQAPPAPCECRDVGDLMNSQTLASFGPSYGSTCTAWNADDCDAKYPPEELGQWCCDKWCYVDQTCAQAQPSLLQPNELFWASVGVCENDPALSAQCPHVPDVEVTAETYAACECLQLAPPAELLPRGAPAAYGSGCEDWDSAQCDVHYPGASRGMWCCETWCYVAPTCPGSQGSVHWPGHYWSYIGCLAEPAEVGDTVYTYTVRAADALSSCPWSDACRCLDSNTGVDTARFGESYGKECDAHDAENCSEWWSGEPSLWTGDKDWCCDSWCYVSQECPISDVSFLGDSVPLFSYATCDDEHAAGPTYSEGTDRCGVERRLGPTAPSDLLGQQTSPAPVLQGPGRHHRGQPPPFRGRRLSARRRGAGTSSSSPTRRRATNSYTPVRRRRSSPDRRRRTASYTAPAAPARRRAPAPPPPRRRRDVRRRTPPVTAPRRRGVPQPAIDGVPYGYGSQNQMYSNYGGVPPMTTDYGYSGQNAYSSGKTSNVAMYALGGAAAGAALGAGAMYMYYSRYDSDSSGFDWMGRRRGHTYSPHSSGWCIEPVGERRMIDCEQCYDRHGVSRCASADSCFEAGGCSYTTTESINRDDLEATGFMPDEVDWPLSVHIIRLAGNDIITSGQSSICPPTTAEENQWWEDPYNRTMSFRADLYVTITEMQVLNDAGSCEQDTGIACVGAPCFAHQDCLERDGGSQYTCVCRQGYCASDGGVCVTTDSALVNASPPSARLDASAIAVCVCVSFLFISRRSRASP